ncbi:protein ENHANCED DOWNY MILDEW 2-like isoform X2 [Phoenix dactylifera]|uniref:Protein ENHANCED DOWNY MILDEW 2-like isoform X2 n=1 Tax=Phoenix dactylifera TaxID=42345 RepID=A0A8B7BPW1_PHODC|nr:protein ENHANCED DOWNY MILDEW 2-like isoform X2 [Phoenix dactylifera]
MESSDDEEIMPQSVTNYYFIDEEESPISFAVLPVLFDDAERPGAAQREVFLRGTADEGLQKVYKQVTAWKLGFQDDRPNVMVLLTENKWINLLKPRKSYYEDTIRATMITLEMLHFLKKRPESSEKGLWDHLRRVFSTFEVRPSEDDFRDHLSLIKLFTERDETLAKCQLLLGFLTDKPRKRTGEEKSRNDPDVKPSFVTADDDLDEDTGDDDGDDSDEESDLFDSVCAICDNGGELICCEGRCMRSFHATRHAGEDSDCKSLGYTRAQIQAIQNFLCKNCQYNQHQCFACGKLGSSDKSAGAEVFRCVSATCGHFYHPKCVAELLFADKPAEASEYQKKIAAGESFTCPVHKCIICKEGENKEVKELQFAMCRRCPKSYHRKCLPRNIAFEDIEEEDIIQRAWDDLLPNRILIYCLKHTIDEDLGTPIRNHIIFPDIPEKKKLTDVQKNKVKLLAEKKRQVSDDLPGDQTSIKLIKVAEKPSSGEKSHSTGKNSKGITEQVLHSQKKVKALKERSQTPSYKADGAVIEVNKISKKEKALTVIPESRGKILSSFPEIDNETEKKMSALMEEASSSLTLEDVRRKCKVPSTHAYSARHIDKSITQGKVEVSVEAIRAALQKLEKGGSVEDAKAVCEPDILKQILKWSNKLKVYLAPFLHGMRYTSFGRHFTKVDKLKEIADKLQWYVQKGDMIVDFCCGANDFCQIMKEKLDAAGKKCNFKNYDVIQPKNDFNFEKRDWMKVQPKELPTGSQLIMGLNPPFGVKGALADKFIDKALTFRPKLLVLIVPEETERLDKKKHPYDLIWEDNQSLSGKSFYLPGSVDVNDKQIEQWNLKPPGLYLWSRPDWTMKHKGIAMKHGHASAEQQEHPADEESQVEKQAEAILAKEHKEGYEEKDATIVDADIRREDNKSSRQGNKRKPVENRKNKSRKRRKSQKRAEVSEGRKLDGFMDMSSRSSPKNRDTRNHSESHLTSEPIKTPLERGNHHSSNSGSGVEFGTFSGTGRSTAFHHEDFDEIATNYMTASNRDNPYNSNSNNWSNGGTSSREYGIRNSEERYSGYKRDNSVNPFGGSPYAGNFDAYGRPSEADYGRPSEEDLRVEQRLYGIQGQDDFSLRNRFSLGGLDSGLAQAGFSSSSYGLSSPNVGTSTMQRYAPRLDETNYGRPGSLGPGVPLHGRSDMYDMPGMRREMPPNPMNFASGSYPPIPPSVLYPPHPPSSGGWLSD